MNRSLATFSEILFHVNVTEIFYSHIKTKRSYQFSQITINKMFINGYLAQIVNKFC
jgi:hypothetical protein